VKVLVKSLNGKMRVFFSNNKTKGCWYGFVGKPVIRLNIDPIIGKENKFYLKYIPKVITSSVNKCIVEIVDRRLS
jgi:hypothetical protein